MVRNYKDDFSTHVCVNNVPTNDKHIIYFCTALNHLRRS